MPHLTLLEKGSGKSHRIEDTEAFAGRDPSCAVLLQGEESKTVSGRHARFFRDGPHWCVEDAGSRNGTFIGSRKLEPGARHILSVGDVVGLGLTGTQLGVREVNTGHSLGATMAEIPATGLRSRSSAHEARLVLRSMSSGTRLVGQGDRITIGRALDCSIRIEGDSATSVSRVHAEVGVDGGRVLVRDGGSRHGTFVNSAKITGETDIRAGDILTLGPGGPAFLVDEVGLAAEGGAVAKPVMAGVVGEEVGPTGVRPAIDSSEQPTPPMDQLAYRKPTISRTMVSSTSASSAKTARRRIAVMLALGLILVAAAAIAFAM